MTVTALEISLNGKVLYTVGMEGWSHLSANISGFRITKEFSELLMSQAGEIPAHFEAGTERLSLSANIALPEPGNPEKSTGHEYEDKMLSVGDVVTIRVIETDSADLPEPVPSRDEILRTPRSSAGDDKE